MVVIRLARFGKVHSPFYRITVAEKKAAPTGRFLERVGTFDPSKSENKSTVNLERFNYWVSKGAQASDRVKKIVRDFQKQTQA